MPKLHKMKDKNYIADIMTECRDVAAKHPRFMEFLEYYCGFTAPVETSDPYRISYSGGKRDVILMLKTLQRSDILPEQIAEYYERNI